MVDILSFFQEVFLNSNNNILICYQAGALKTRGMLEIWETANQWVQLLPNIHHLELEGHSKWSGVALGVPCAAAVLVEHRGSDPWEPEPDTPFLRRATGGSYSPTWFTSQHWRETIYLTYSHVSYTLPIVSKTSKSSQKKNCSLYPSHSHVFFYISHNLQGFKVQPKLFNVPFTRETDPTGPSSPSPCLSFRASPSCCPWQSLPHPRCSSSPELPFIINNS